MHHVFDFLNQMGMMSSFPVARTDGAIAGWTVSPNMEGTLRDRATPAIVSLRAYMDKQLDDGSSYHVIGVVFENGVFVNIPIHHPSGSRSTQERIDFFSRTHLDQEGNVCFADGSIKDRDTLYKEAVDVFFQKGPKIEGIGISGPWLRASR